MQAVRLARYHTGRSHLVRFCGAYHGWWGDVQPGVGNPVPARETYTLKDMSDATLRVLRTPARHRLRAGQSAAGAASERRRAGGFRPGRQRRAARISTAPPTPTGSSELRAVCSERGIVLIFDEVFVGFPPRARRRAGVFRRRGRHGHLRQDARRRPADRRGLRPQDLMKRFRDDRPADICFARGTFNSHPYVMGAMHEFLQRLETPEAAGALPRSRRDLERARGAAQSPPARRAGCRCRWRTCPRSGRSATRSRRATTGCCNIICAPRAWR